MAIRALIVCTAVVAVLIDPSHGVGSRRFNSMSSSSNGMLPNGCSTQTRLAKLTCPCNLGAIGARCEINSNSFCTGAPGAAVCACSSPAFALDNSQGGKCQLPLSVSAPAFGVVCGPPAAMTNAVTVQFALTIKDPVLPVTCAPALPAGTPIPATGGATYQFKVAPTGTVTAAVILGTPVNSSPSFTAVVFTCTDARSNTATATVLVSTKTAC